MADPAAEPSGRKGKITAADVIGLATKESSRAWADRNRSISPGAGDGGPIASGGQATAAVPEPVSVDNSDPVNGVNHYEEEEEMAEVAVPDITPIVRHRTPSPDVDLVEVPASNNVIAFVSEEFGPKSSEEQLDVREEFEENLPDEKPKRAARNTRKTRAKKATHPPPVPTRSLRSRDSKSEGQQQAERAKRARIRAALGSDAEEDED